MIANDPPISEHLYRTAAGWTMTNMPSNTDVNADVDYHRLKADMVIHVVDEVALEDLSYYSATGYPISDQLYLEAVRQSLSLVASNTDARTEYHCIKAMMIINMVDEVMGMTVIKGKL